MPEYKTHTAIRHWAEEDRPREKLLLRGRSNLSDAELLAILLGSGNRESSAVDLARTLLSKYHDNLIDLARAGYHDLISFKGIGQVKAVTIIAALELGRRRNESGAVAREKIASSQDAYQVLRTTLSDLHYESFWIILLNRANKVLKKCMISEGGVTGTVVDPRRIFKIAVDHHACSIILGHNHPSGNPLPSESDINLSRKLKEAGRLLDIEVLDHIIVGEEKFYSFRDEGII